MLQRYDIGLMVLRDPDQLIPGVANPANDEMISPFSPFENGYQVVAAAVPPVQPAAPAAGVNGQNVTYCRIRRNRLWPIRHHHTIGNPADQPGGCSGTGGGGCTGSQPNLHL